MQQSNDIVIIGGGPAGYVAAIRAAQDGARVLLSENEKPAGTWVNSGCVPTKVFLADVKPFFEIERSPLAADGTIPVLSFEKMLKQKRRVADHHRRQKPHRVDRRMCTRSAPGSHNQRSGRGRQRAPDVVSVCSRPGSRFRRGFREDPRVPVSRG